MVITIIGIVVGLAVPNLRPLQHANKLTGSTEVVAGFVDDARRLSFNSGRCHRVKQVGDNLELQRRTHADCVTLDEDDWETVRTMAPEYQGIEFKVEHRLDGAETKLTDSIIFRPSNRLFSEDLNTRNDSARITIAYDSQTSKKKVVQVTPLGRICIVTYETTVPALTAPYDCAD